MMKYVTVPIGTTVYLKEVISSAESLSWARGNVIHQERKIAPIRPKRYAPNATCWNVVRFNCFFLEH